MSVIIEASVEPAPLTAATLLRRRQGSGREKRPAHQWDASHRWAGDQGGGYGPRAERHRTETFPPLIRILKEQRKDDYQFTTTRPKASWDHHGGQHFILLVEPMFVLACLASLPGTPRRALDAAGLVLVWFGVCNAGSVEKTSTKPRAAREQDVSVIVTY